MFTGLTGATLHISAAHTPQNIRAQTHTAQRRTPGHFKHTHAARAQTTHPATAVWHATEGNIEERTRRRDAGRGAWREGEPQRRAKMTPRHGRSTPGVRGARTRRHRRAVLCTHQHWQKREQARQGDARGAGRGSGKGHSPFAAATSVGRVGALRAPCWQTPGGHREQYYCSVNMEASRGSQSQRGEAGRRRRVLPTPINQRCKQREVPFFTQGKRSKGGDEGPK